MKRITVIAALILTVVAGIASADPAARTQGVNRRQHHQVQRIRQGVRSGQLTKDEAKGLVQDEREIQRMKRGARSDGVVTRDERRDLHQRMNAESRKIYEEKHDAATR